MNKERLLHTFTDLVQLDSESRNERAVADYCKAKLTSLGFSVTEDGAAELSGGNAGNIIAVKPGVGKTILLSSHMDTVAPGCGVKPEIREGIVRSDGTTVLGGDDKSGIAAILEAAETLQETGTGCGTIVILLTVSEEVGLLGSKYADLSKLPAIDAAYCFDSDGAPNEITVAAPFHVDFTAHFQGKAAHAGMEPENGVSAVEMAALAIADMRLGRIDEETTANIGIIQGGTATNVVAEKVTLYGEARSLQREKLDAQIAAMQFSCEWAAAKVGGKVEIELEESYAAIQLDPESNTIVLAKAALEKMGLEPQLVKSGGGSDANVFCGKGVPTANVGCGMMKVHGVSEYLVIEHMEQAAEFIVTVLTEAAK